MNVRRPSPLRVMPVLFLCFVAVVVALSHVSWSVSLVCVLAAVPASYLIIELMTHSVEIDQRSVTDRRLHQVSVTHGARQQVAVRGTGKVPTCHVRDRRWPAAVHWTDTDGNVHSVSFLWFSRSAADDIIAAVHALGR
ncbi:MAG: hypothetical protein JWN99_3173 [Ilumatobacteraceae bacterium]|nr:hypothetical protein [Ilumatobacteraceae bacterium]